MPLGSTTRRYREEVNLRLDSWTTDRDRQKAFVADILTGIQRVAREAKAGTRSAQWHHPAWVTPFDGEPPPVPPDGITDELARLGVVTGEDYWLELWYGAPEI